MFALAKSFKISYLEIAFLNGQKYSSYFDVYASKDSLNWDLILENASSCDFSGDMQVFDFPVTMTNTEYSFIKLIGHGNSVNSCNDFSEIKVFGHNAQNPNPNEIQNIKIIFYPNPAQDFLNITTNEVTFHPCSFRIIDFSGSTIFEGSLDQGLNSVQIPNNIKSGAYLIELRLNKLILDVQKLMINR
jgi:hypothetical protein